MAPTAQLENTTQAISPIGELTLDVLRSGSGDEVGETVRLSDLKGRVVVLFVLGVDCGTCKHVARLLAALQNEYSAAVSVLGICVQNGCQDKIGEFEASAQLLFPLTYSAPREIYRALGIPRSTWLFFPTLIFIDREQILRGVFVGGSDFYENLDINVREQLNRLLSGAPVECTQEEARV